MKDLPEAGPPFQVGETVAFFPAEIGPASMWLAWDMAIIDDINEAAQSFGFHFVSDPGQRHGQGFENIVRPTENYQAWRSAWEATLARTGDEDAADAETMDLWLRVIAEHPIHGGRSFGTKPYRLPRGSLA